MQILQGRNATSDLPMSHAARKQIGIQPEVIRNSDKHIALPTHYHNVGQHVMFQDSTSEHWYPAIIKGLCPEPRSYKILTRNGIVYRIIQSHLKPFTPQNKMSQYTKCVSSPVLCKAVLALSRFDTYFFIWNVSRGIALYFLYMHWSCIVYLLIIGFPFLWVLARIKELALCNVITSNSHYI